MSNTHTPGPWRGNLSPNTKHPTCVGMVVNADNERIIEVNADSRVTEDTVEANARLISAAPELLEALEKCCKDIEFWNDVLADEWLNFDGQLNHALNQARAAIAKTRP